MGKGFGEWWCLLFHHHHWEVMYRAVYFGSGTETHYHCPKCGRKWSTGE